MMNSRGKSFQTKQEGGDADESSTRTNTTTTASTSTSRQWAGFRNPRIVRVSRSFGGKDRHSKVCTVRGLRDRRIRLSVPTAIQLYDLQDRLGLSQPSKVVDWLIDNTKSDIDKLPPLQFPPENFLNMGSSSSSTSQFPNFFNNIGSTSNADPAGSSVGLDQLTAQNFFPVGNQSSFPTLLNNPIFPYNNPFYHWDAQLGQSNGIIPMHTQDSNINTTGSTSTTSMLLPASASHQLYFCPPSLPSYMAQAQVLENDPTRQGGVNHFQFLNSASSAPVLQPNSSLMPTLHFIRPEILRMQENNSNHPNKGGNTGT